MREDDWTQVAQEKVRNKEKATEAAQFRRDFKSAAATARAPGPGGGKEKADYKGRRSLPEPSGHIAQAKAKLMLPPKSFLWRARATNSWIARYSDWTNRSARDAAHGGEASALAHVLQWAWKCYLDASGLSAADCPIAGLLPDAELVSKRPAPRGRAASASG